MRRFSWQVVLDAHPHLRYSLVVIFWLSAMTFLGRTFFLHEMDNSIVIMLYLLTVFLISRFTSGYIYGVIGSFLSVFLFNFFFTEPYYSIDVYDAKYPMIFLIMLIVSLVTSAMTIRVRKSAEEKIRLAQMQEKTRQDLEAEKLRSTILRSVSHDLRTPLTSISGSVSLLLDNSSDLSPDERRKLLSDVFTESIWLNRFVENLLSLTRIDDHLMKINICPELVEEVIGETVSLVRRRLNTCQVKVSIPDKPVMVNMDSSLIEQVLINLIDNAAAHTPLNGLIELSVEAESGQMVFRVRDHGPGILPDDFEKIFERYFVGSETRFDLKRGQGLGLSICQSILQAHQSRLTAANHPDGGAVFEFALSLAMEG